MPHCDYMVNTQLSIIHLRTDYAACWYGLWTCNRRVADLMPRAQGSVGGLNMTLPCPHPQLRCPRTRDISPHCSRVSVCGQTKDEPQTWSGGISEIPVRDAMGCPVVPGVFAKNNFSICPPEGALSQANKSRPTPSHRESRVFGLGLCRLNELCK